MKGKRGTDHEWNLVKYDGDGAIYAECRCGHYYNCGRDLKNKDGLSLFKQIPTIFYPYCPCCGARKKRFNSEIEKRSMEQRFNKKKFGTIYDISSYFKNE